MTHAPATKAFTVAKIQIQDGIFVSSEEVQARDPWDALDLAGANYPDPHAPDYFGIYGETSGDLRIADRDGIHWWMVNWEE